MPELYGNRSFTTRIYHSQHGFATVQLPEWFEALNTDFRYQLTVMGQFAQAIVSGKVANHQFGIQTDKPNVEVSWQITGICHDAYTKAYPLVVEQQKDAHTRGHYIHPELYGQPASTHSQAQQLSVPPGLKNTHPPTNPAASHK